MDRQGPQDSGRSAIESTRPKYRPQQSCLKCRERKIKCDRAKPCRACCTRGLESECQYVTNNEERFQIGQADIIETLRRQVSELKKHIEEQEQSTQSWPQPPRGTGSGVSQRHAQMDARSFALGHGEVRISGTGSHATSSGYPDLVVRTPHAAPYLGPSSGHGLIQAPPGPFDNGWGTGSPVVGVNPYGPSNTLVFSDGNPNLHYQFPPHGSMSTRTWEPLVGQTSPGYQPPGSHSDGWKGKSKLMQDIFDTICACDDSRVSPLINIIRTSPTPEDAFISIYQNIQPTQPIAPANPYYSDHGGRISWDDFSNFA